MGVEEVPFAELLSNIVDNRGRTCPTADIGIPLIATNCIRNDLLYPAYERIRYVSQETYGTWFRGHPKPGDLIFVTKGTPGRVCMASDPVDFCIAQDMVAVRADPKKVCPQYLFALLRSPMIQARIEQMHVGTLIPHFRKGDFGTLFLPIPDRDTQRFIGDAYFLFSAKIELNQQMSQTLEAMARAIFKSWFVDFDPVRARAAGQQPPLSAVPGTVQAGGLAPHIADLFPDAFEGSELGEIPKGWNVSTVGAEVHSIRGRSYRSKELAESTTALVTLKSINRGGGYRPDGLKAFTGEYKPEQIVKPGELVVAQTDVTQAAAVIGKPAIVLPSSDYSTLVASLDLSIVRPKGEDISTYFLYCLFLTDDFQAHVYGHTNGTTVLHLSKSGLPSYRFARPSAQAAVAFKRIAEPLFQRLITNEQESHTLAAIRDALLPKLLSGQIRVKDMEGIATDT